jgi:hypothetical protein
MVRGAWRTVDVICLHPGYKPSAVSPAISLVLITVNKPQAPSARFGHLNALSNLRATLVVRDPCSLAKGIFNIGDAVIVEVHSSTVGKPPRASTA